MTFANLMVQSDKDQESNLFIRVPLNELLADFESAKIEYLNEINEKVEVHDFNLIHDFRFAFYLLLLTLIETINCFFNSGLILLVIKYTLIFSIKYRG